MKEALKTRTAEVILDRLKDFLSNQIVIELSLAFAIRPSITICCTVTTIIKEYQSTDENEETVAKLLEKLLQIHFLPISQELLPQQNSPEPPQEPNDSAS